VQGYPAPNTTGLDGARQKFTSKERDIETGLDYFLARYYSSTQDGSPALTLLTIRRCFPHVINVFLSRRILVVNLSWSFPGSWVLNVYSLLTSTLPNSLTKSLRTTGPKHASGQVLGVNNTGQQEGSGQA